jgi:hypothetical protein
MQPILFARVGAVFYGLWGVVHIYAAYDYFKFANSVQPLAASARLNLLAAYLGSAGVATIVIAAKSNWRNQALGYWLNLTIVSIMDIFYIAFVVIPTDLPVLEAWTGPALWIAAVITSTIGFLRRGQPRV